MRPPRVLPAVFIALAILFAAALWHDGWADLGRAPTSVVGGCLSTDATRKRPRLSVIRCGAAALMRAGDFKTAAEVFSGMDTADAAYDAGNASVMLGKYDDAVARYERALVLRPGWAEAEANLSLARLRAARLKAPGGDAGDQREGADEIVYDKDKKSLAGEKMEPSARP